MGVGRRGKIIRSYKTKKARMMLLPSKIKGGKENIPHEREDSKDTRDPNLQFAVPTFASSSSYLLVALTAALLLYGL